MLLQPPGQGADVSLSVQSLASGHIFHAMEGQTDGCSQLRGQPKVSPISYEGQLVLSARREKKNHIKWSSDALGGMHQMPSARRITTLTLKKMNDGHVPLLG